MVTNGTTRARIGTTLTQVDGDWTALEVGTDRDPAGGIAVGTHGDRWQFSASDGCNLHDGYLDITADGDLDVRIPVQGLQVMCHGWHYTANLEAMQAAASIWLDGDVVRLVDAEGHVLGRYELAE